MKTNSAPTRPLIRPPAPPPYRRLSGYWPRLPPASHLLIRWLVRSALPCSACSRKYCPPGCQDTPSHERQKAGGSAPTPSLGPPPSALAVLLPNPHRPD